MHEESDEIIPVQVFKLPPVGAVNAAVALHGLAEQDWVPDNTPSEHENWVSPLREYPVSHEKVHEESESISPLQVLRLPLAGAPPLARK